MPAARRALPSGAATTRTTPARTATGKAHSWKTPRSFGLTLAIASAAFSLAVATASAAFSRAVAIASAAFSRALAMASAAFPRAFAIASAAFPRAATTFSLALAILSAAPRFRSSTTGKAYPAVGGLTTLRAVVVLDRAGARVGACRKRRVRGVRQRNGEDLIGLDGRVALDLHGHLLGADAHREVERPARGGVVVVRRGRGSIGSRIVDAGRQIGRTGESDRVGEIGRAAVALGSADVIDGELGRVVVVRDGREANRRRQADP